MVRRLNQWVRSNLSLRLLVLSGMLAFFRAGSMHFAVQTDLRAIFRVSLFLFRLCFYFLLFTAALKCVYVLLERITSRWRLQEDSVDHLQVRWKRIDAIKYYLVLFVGWLPNLIIKYPGALCWDTWRLLHYYRLGVLDGHHSIFYSFVTGTMIGLFERIGHANFGLFLLLILQYVLYVIVFGYSLQMISSLGFRKMAWLATGYWLFCPYVIGYHGVLIKDAPYAAFMALFSMLLIEITLDEEAFCKNRWKVFLLAVSVMGCCLIRKNGVYVVGLSTVLSFFCIRETKRTVDGQNRQSEKEHGRLSRIGGKKGYQPFVVILAALSLTFAINSILTLTFEVEKGSIREALSIPFQQTARYVKYHSEDVTEEEREIIDDVLQYDTLAKRYNPRRSDSVKNKYTENGEKLGPYFVVWFRQFFRHPLCYLAATWEQNYYLFTPENEWENIVLYRDDDVGYEIGERIAVSEHTDYYENLFHNSQYLDQWKDWVINEYYAIHRSIPVGLLSNVSINTYLLILLFALVQIKGRRYLAPFFPMIFTVMFVVLGPVIYGHPRYMFPVIYCAPVLVAYSVFVYAHK